MSIIALKHSLYVVKLAYFISSTNPVIKKILRDGNPLSMGIIIII